MSHHHRRQKPQRAAPSLPWASCRRTRTPSCCPPLPIASNVMEEVEGGATALAQYAKCRTNASSKNRRESGGQGLRPDERGSARVRGKASRAKQPACSQLRGLVAFVSRPALAALARRHGPHTPERRRYASRRECEQSRHALHTYPACATDPLPPWQIPPPDVERLPVFPGIHRPRRLSLRAQSVKRAHSRADAN